MSGALAHWRRGNVDFRMGGVLLVGRFVGSALGVWLFTFLRSIGQIDFVIAVVCARGIIGVLMVVKHAIMVPRPQSRPAPQTP